ncbi:MAG: hypothetical protein J6U12_02605 [Candidatus Methanomethylophilaceae archaeon]|nr:hypothetical protein [Candidatus Methanomethylophilaceae archaeon]MBP5735462.1 hypothetical protein [Candidatus Methanomethylophilaceae archaeon]
MVKNFQIGNVRKRIEALSTYRQSGWLKLVDRDVIERKVLGGSPPSVYCAISKEGYSMIPSMMGSYEWIIQHMPELKG